MFCNLFFWSTVLRQTYTHCYRLVLIGFLAHFWTGLYFDNKNDKLACAKRTYIQLYCAGVHIQPWNAFKNCLMMITSHSLSTEWLASCSYSQPLKTNKRTCNKIRLCSRSKLYGLNWIECRHFSQGTTLALLRDERSLYACRKWTQTHSVVGKWPATFRNF